MIRCHRYTYTYTCIGIVWLRAPNESRPFHSSWTRTLLGGVWNVHNFCETCTTSCKRGQLLWIRRQVLKHCKELLIRLYPHICIHIYIYIIIIIIIISLYCIILIYTYTVSYTVTPSISASECWWSLSVCGEVKDFSPARWIRRFGQCSKINMSSSRLPWCTWQLWAVLEHPSNSD